MRSSSNSEGASDKPSIWKRMNKAQFFMLTGFVIITMFYSISRWLEPYTIIDMSIVPMLEETFIFSNIKQEAMDVIDQGKSCEGMVNNLEEFKTYIEDYSFRKLIIYFDYSMGTPCLEEDPFFPTLVLFDMGITSSRMTVRDEFYGFWPPGSSPF